MKTKNLMIVCLVIFSAFIQNSCVKEGPQGPAGLNGTNGLNGNANVIASPWISPTVWAGQTGDWYFDVNSTAITQDIVENGVILAYMSIPGDIYAAPVRPMPAIAAGARWDFLVPDYGKIEFTCDALNAPGTTGYTFRFILMTSSIHLKSATTKGLNKSNLQNMPYKDVCKLLGIQE